MTPSLARRATTEVFGTFALVFFGCGVIAMDAFPGARSGVMGVALVHALVLSVAVSAGMMISGAQFNPAVTLGLLAVRRIGIVDAGVYIASQLAGALLAVVTLKSLVPATAGRLVAWGTPLLNSQVTLGQGIMLEALLTFFLMSAVMGTVVATNAPRIGGFGVGLTLFFAIMVGGPLTGAAMNPARAFGPAVITGTYSGHAVYWIGPIVGAVLAAMLWHHFLLKGEPVVDGR